MRRTDPLRPRIRRARFRARATRLYVSIHGPTRPVPVVASMLRRLGVRVDRRSMIRTDEAIGDRPDLPGRVLWGWADASDLAREAGFRVLLDPHRGVAHFEPAR